MYPVSTAFLTAVKANTRKYYWTGRITTKAGDVYDFDQNDIVRGSGYITSQCCGNSWRLEPTDKLPVGKKPCLSLRELEKQIGYDLDTQMDPVGKKSQWRNWCSVT